MAARGRRGADRSRPRGRCVESGRADQREWCRYRACAAVFAKKGAFARNQDRPFLHALARLSVELNRARYEHRLERLARRLSDLGLIYCAGGRAPHFPDPFRQIATAILLKRSKKWPRPPTLLATIAQVRQPPRVRLTGFLLKIPLPLSSRFPSRSFSTSRSYLVCRFIQNRSVMPKNRERRNAVSAVIALFPCTISLIRRAGTLMALARRYWLTSIGFRNSSKRISPGCIGVTV